MKLFLIKFTYAFLSCVVIIFLASCSILDYQEEQNKSKYSQNNVKKNKCPSTKIPSKTASYISTKKYILSIKKIEMVCKNEVVRSSNVLDMVVQFKVKMELKTNNKIKTKDLNFKTLKYNSLACQISRNKIEKNTFDAIGNIAFTLSKISMDICLYSGDEFQFISFPENITTGSSIMPHKKNPDVFEIIRGKCNSIQNLSNSVNLSSTNLPSGYHRDFQLNKGKIINAVNDIKECIQILSYCLSMISVNKKILQKSNYENIFSVELINEMVLKGMPFRDAYLELKSKLKSGEIKFPKTVNHSHIGSIGNLALDKIVLKMKDYY